MISRLHRFHGHASLQTVYRRGQSVRGPFLSLKYMARPRSDQYRAAVVVSRKVSKSAVVRNRIRRRVYELIRAEADRIGGYDLVFTAFDAQLAALDQAKLQREVAALLTKAGVQAAPDSNRQAAHDIVNSEGKND